MDMIKSTIAQAHEKGYEVEITIPLNKQKYNTLMNSQILYSPEKTIIEENYHYVNGIRMRRIANNVSYSIKKRLETFIYNNYKIKISKEEKAEEPIEKIINYQRIRKRTSGLLLPYNTWKLEFSEHKENNEEKEKYEVEIELAQLGKHMEHLDLLLMIINHPAPYLCLHKHVTLLGLSTHYDLFSNKPKTMNQIININQYAVARKADGVSAFTICYNKNMYIYGPKFEIIHSGTCAFADSNVMIFGEYISTSSNDLFVITDILIVNDTIIANDSYEKRYKFIKCLKYDNVDRIKFYLKKVYFPNDKQTLALKKDANFPSDGIIFTENNKSFFNASIYKWKPEKYQTIDFLIKKRMRYCELYVYSRKRKDIKMKKTKTLPYKDDKILILFGTVPCDIVTQYPDNSIVEFRRENNKWIPVRLREDKENPNSYLSANFVINSKKLQPSLKDIFTHKNE